MGMGTKWDLLVKNEELSRAAETRKKNYIEIKVKKDELEFKKNDGWVVKKEYKNGSVLLTKRKKIGDSFEDEIWMLFYKMGFKIMNKNNSFELSYSSEYPNLTKQIDVIAIDDETCLFIECKETSTLNKHKSWATEISEISGHLPGLINEIKKQYPNRKYKYIFATKNFVLNQQDIDRLKNAKIAYFDNETTDYYKALVEHLGVAARYQFLGNLFAGMDISGMEDRVPAIEGKMGNLTYYSFSIEPERLLKISYVLHRNNANRDMMPTYQRLIKKERLKSIRAFVNNGGYFPNSLIISIDDPKNKIYFDKAKQDIPNSVSRIGILHLPKKYQSAYIIDGQHRLYGYSESKFAFTNSIPVVAFVNLDKDTQIKMFMDINENQKSVSKSLRNTLIINMNFDSENLTKRREAVMLDIAQKLGEKKDSPLYGRVITGENTVTAMRCITIEYLKYAFDKTNFFSKYNKKNEMISAGILDRTDGKKTVETVYSFIVKCLNLIQTFCEEEWSKGSNGFITINNTIVAIIRIINDIVNLSINKNGLPQIIYNLDELYNYCEPFLYSLCDVLEKLPPEKRNEIKTKKGGSAKDESYILLQLALHDYDSTFITEELENYISENCSEYNDESQNYIESIKKTYIQFIRNKFIDNNNWKTDYLPEDLDKKINNEISNQQLKNRRNGTNIVINEWDIIGFEDIVKIITYKNNWNSLLKTIFVDGYEKKDRTDVINTLKTLSNLEKKISNGTKISKSEYDNILKICDNLKLLDKSNYEMKVI